MLWFLYRNVNDLIDIKPTVEKRANRYTKNECFKVVLRSKSKMCHIAAYHVVAVFSFFLFLLFFLYFYLVIWAATQVLCKHSFISMLVQVLCSFGCVSVLRFQYGFSSSCIFSLQYNRWREVLLYKNAWETHVYAVFTCFSLKSMGTRKAPKKHMNPLKKWQLKNA